MNKIFCQAISFEREEDSNTELWRPLLLASSGFFSALAPHLCAISELTLTAKDFYLLRKAPTFPLATTVSFNPEAINASGMKEVLADIEYVRVLRFSNTMRDEDWEAEMQTIIDSLPWLIKVHLSPDPGSLDILKHLLRHRSESVRRYAACQIRDDKAHEFCDGDSVTLLELLREDMIPQLLDKPGETDAATIDSLDSIRQVLVTADVARRDVRALADRFLNMLDPDAGNRTPVLHSAAACLYSLIVTNTTEIDVEYRVRLLRGARDAGLLSRIALALCSVAQETVPLVAQNLGASEDDAVRRKREEADKRQRREALRQEIRQKKKTRRKHIDIGVDTDSESEPELGDDNGVEYRTKHEHDANTLLFVDLEVRYVSNLVLSLAWFMHILPVGTDKLEQLEQQQQNGLVGTLLSIINNDAFFQYIDSRPQLQLQNMGPGIRSGIWRVLAFFTASCPVAMLARGIPQQAMQAASRWHSLFSASHTGVWHLDGPSSIFPDIAHWELASAPLSVVTALLHVPHRSIEHVAAPNAGNDDEEEEDAGSEGDVSDFGDDDLRLSLSFFDGLEMRSHLGNQVEKLSAAEQVALQARMLLVFGKGRDEFNIGPTLSSFFLSLRENGFSSDNASQMETVAQCESQRLSRGAVAAAMHFGGLVDITFHLCFALRFEKQYGTSGDIEATTMAVRRGRTATYLVQPGSPRPVVRFFMENEKTIAAIVERHKGAFASVFAPEFHTIVGELKWDEEGKEEEGDWCPGCRCYH